MNFDFDSLFSTTTHPKICEKNGFGGKEFSVVRKWSAKADKYPCGSNRFYSAPFHARGNALEIGSKLYNFALKAKLSAKPLSFTFDEEQGKINISFLKYIDKTNPEKTEKAQYDFLNLINNKTPEYQSDVLLGLALHTIQDFFAHVVRVDLYCARDNFYNEKGYVPVSVHKDTMCYEVDELMGLSNNDIEDNIRVMSWRYEATCKITSAISEKWKSNSEIHSLTAEPTGNIKFYKRIKGFFLWKKYWTVSYKEYKWILK